jgi:hypothetical protein
VTSWMPEKGAALWPSQDKFTQGSMKQIRTIPNTTGENFFNDSCIEIYFFLID